MARRDARYRGTTNEWPEAGIGYIRNRDKRPSHAAAPQGNAIQSSIFDIILNNEVCAYDVDHRLCRFTFTFPVNGEYHLFLVVSLHYHARDFASNPPSGDTRKQINSVC